jgi:hypothetical protein
MRIVDCETGRFGPLLRFNSPGGIALVRSIRAAFGHVTLTMTIMALLAVGDTAKAQGKLEAQYVVTLAGIPVGKGRWTIEIADDKFTATASGGTAGLLRVFASGEGNSSAQGVMVGGTPVSTIFSATITTDKKTEEFRMTVEGGNVKDLSVVPPPQTDSERVPLTDAHRRGINDPMTASLIRVPGNANLMGPEACQRTLSVFDGRIRYDVKLAYKRVDQIAVDKSYSGPSVVCAVTFVPIAGHNPNRAAVKYVINSRDMELWLVPIAGTRVVVPYRFAIPTPIGLGIMQATEFVSVAQPARTTAASAKNP